MKRDRWPVTKEDCRSNPDKCFYCPKKLGEEHDEECVIRKRSVVITVTLSYVVLEPESWDKRMIEFSRNESSWCASNVMHEIEALHESQGCLCNSVKIDYVREATKEDEERCGVSIYPHLKLVDSEPDHIEGEVK